MYKLSVLVFLLCSGASLAGLFTPSLLPASNGWSSHSLAAPAALGYSGYYSSPGLINSGLTGYSTYSTGAAAAAAPIYSGIHYGQAAPSLVSGYTQYAAAAPAASAVYTGPASVQNVYAERDRVEPGEQYIYKVQAPPRVHKEVVQVAQVVKQPKVLYSEVVAQPKVDRVTVVQEPKPQLVNVQPQIHKEQLVVVQPKAEPKVFVAQKRRDTIAKRTEYEQHKFQTTHNDGGKTEVRVIGTNQYQQAPTVYVENQGTAPASSVFHLPSAGSSSTILTSGSAGALLPSSIGSITKLSQAPSVSLINSFSSNDNRGDRHSTFSHGSSNTGLPSLSMSSSSSLFSGIKNA